VRPASLDHAELSRNVDLQLDARLSFGYRSPSQLARVLTQDWVRREAYCLSCGESGLDRVPENTRALDFRCSECREPYELKASRRPFLSRILDGEYGTFVRALASHENPNLLLLNYDYPRLAVTDFQAIPRHTLSRLSVIPRRPLGQNARRAGWQGCNIDLKGLPQSALVRIVVDGAAREQSNVLNDWHRFEFIAKGSRSSRDWLPDVLNVLRRLESEEFKLSEVYEFASELRILHPRNSHVEPKIRQQLQLMITQGLIERVRPGHYRKTKRF
jgi:type II restriction enzyme